MTRSASSLRSVALVDSFTSSSHPCEASMLRLEKSSGLTGTTLGRYVVSDSAASTASCALGPIFYQISFLVAVVAMEVEVAFWMVLFLAACHHPIEF
jgi:hypothetical protein